MKNRQYGYRTLHAYGLAAQEFVNAGIDKTYSLNGTLFLPSYFQLSLMTTTATSAERNAQSHQAQLIGSSRQRITPQDYREPRNCLKGPRLSQTAFKIPRVIYEADSREERKNSRTVYLPATGFSPMTTPPRLSKTPTAGY
jgi:hypothetical protein